MAASSAAVTALCGLTRSSSRRLQRDSLKGLSFMLIFLALISSIFLLFYSSSTLKLDKIHQEGLKPAIVNREEPQQVVHSQINMYKKVLPEEEVAVMRPSKTSHEDDGDHGVPWARGRESDSDGEIDN